MSKSNDDNRADQLNPNNDAFWTSRGYDGRPDDWDDRDDDTDDDYWYDGYYYAVDQGRW